jgi:hypothetical protein
MIILGPTRGIVSYTSATAFDPDAAAYFTAAGITNATQKNAWNDAVVSLKAESLWAKIVTIRPYLGGTAGSHAVNAKNPATFGYTWHGTVTHNANGITGDGSTGYASGDAAPSDIGATGGLAFYKRVSGTGDNQCPIGSDDAVSDFFAFIENNAFNQKYGMWGSNVNAIQAGAPGVGFWAINRTSTTDLQLFLNGASLNTNTTLTSFSGLTQPMFALARNTGGFPTGFCDGNYALHCTFVGMATGDMATLSTIIQTFQTALGRNV